MIFIKNKYWEVSVLASEGRRIYISLQVFIRLYSESVLKICSPHYYPVIGESLAFSLGITTQLFFSVSDLNNRSLNSL